MHELVRQRIAEISKLCHETGVRRLDLFGSALDEGFAESSDVDLLVEFDAAPGFDHFGNYFALKEGLERLLGRPVDLVTASGIRNPYFRNEVMATKEALYAA